jgi:hypothetical protein
LKTLGLVSCTKRKLDHDCKASEMYSPSDLFSKAYTYCKKQYDQVAILSAKHYFLLPEEPIEPYNLTLNDMSAEQRKVWSEKVFEQMKNKLKLANYDKVFFHAGKKYRNFLIPKLENIGIKCEVPLEHIGI